jgi:maltose/moltooligosaccharide transporter
VLGIALLFGAAGLAALGVIDKPMLLAPAFAGIAVAWSALGNLPYAIAGSTVHWTRISHILRIFSFSTILPQVAVSLGLAVFGAALFGSATQTIMIAGGVSMAVGGLLSLGFRERLRVQAEETP